MRNLSPISHAKIFKALSDDNRLRIIRLLLGCPKSICVCEIVDALKLPQYQISKQLNILKNAGVVQCESRGKWAYYSLSAKGDSAHFPFLNFVKNNIKDPRFMEDQNKLRKRLSLRKGDCCVIGFAKRKKGKDEEAQRQ